MPIDKNATQWVVDSGLQAGLLSQFKRKDVLEGKFETIICLFLYIYETILWESQDENSDKLRKSIKNNPDSNRNMPQIRNILRVKC